jgi:GTP-binding protein EngB required for normal cell division
MSLLSIVVIGFQNSGKSTVINALLKGQYAAISSVECTRKLFHFRLHRSANQFKNQDESAEVCFPVRVSEDIFDTIIPRLQMEIVDSPGIGTKHGSLGMDFIELNADTVVCILVVLDISRCDASARQRNRDLLLRLSEGPCVDVHSRCIVLGNKEDQLINAGREEAIQCMKSDVEQVLGADASFNVISAQQILYYRYACGLKFETFQSNYLGKVCEMGKTILKTKGWKLNTRTGFRSLHRVLTNKENYEWALSLDVSNFGAFLDTLGSKIKTSNMTLSNV